MYSFVQTGTQTSFNNTQSFRKASESQIKYYLDLCKTRNEAPKNYHLLSFEQLRGEIERLKISPASDKQKELITQKLSALSEIGINIQTPEIETLTGGKDGSASNLIASLLLLEKEHSNEFKPSDAQLQLIVGYYFCPDVPFENYGIEKRVMLEDGFWRQPTPDEFAEQIKQKMNRPDASRFIDENRGVFHTWKTTRCTMEQIKMIREMESRLNAPSPLNVKEFSMDSSGNLVPVVSNKSNKDAFDKNYNSMDDIQLMMMSKEEASKYIDILKSEKSRTDLYQFGETSDDSMSFETMRGNAKSQTEALEKEAEFMIDLIFKLEAVAGMEFPELHELTSDAIVLGEALLAKRSIRECMMNLVETDAITASGLMTMVEGSKTATNIVLGLF